MLSIHLHTVPLFIKKWFKDYLWDISTCEKIIYLTFDDGPIPEITPFVLSELAKYNAKATFFCVGDNINKHPEVFRKLLAEGHAFGNHTYNHLKGWQTENEIYFENIEKLNRVVVELGIKPSKLFRPPYGRLKSSQGKYLKSKYTIVMWSLLTCDYDKNFDAQQCLENAKRKTRNGSIVVFHDSLKAEKNLRYVLPKYLAYFADKGFRFDTLY